MTAQAPVAAPIGAKVVNPWLVAPTVAMAAFMEVLDISIANVALQHIAGDMSASPEEATWILTSYLVTNAIVLPISAWLSAVMGRKRFFLTCIAGFTASSLLCGMAPTLATLIIFRGIQGLTGGGLQPSAQAILADAFPPHQRGMAFALYGMAVVFAPAIGPTLGGWITDSASWRWVFLLNVPVGLLLLVLASAMVQDPPEMVALRESRRGEKLRIDYLGFSLLALGLGSLQLVLDKGQQEDWFSTGYIVVATVAAVVGLVAFVIWELGQDEPIVDLRLLADRNFGLSNILMFVLGFVLLASTVLLPELVQRLMGYTATDAGLLMTPGGFALMAVTLLVGRMTSLLDPRKLVVAGLVVCSASLWLSGGLTLDADFSTFMWLRVFLALGLSLLFIPINTAAYIGLPRTKSSSAAALINLARNLGGSVGISTVTTHLERSAQSRQTDLVAHATALDAPYRATIDHMVGLFLRQGDTLVQATVKAQAEIYGMIQRQATMLAFLDDFRLLAVLFLLVIPIAMLMRRPPKQPGPPAPAH